MRIYYYLLPVILAVVLCIPLAGCTAPAKDSASGEKGLTELAEEDTVPVADAGDEVWQEPLPDPLDEYTGDPAEDVTEMAMELAEKLGYDTSKMFVIAQEEIYRSAEIWIWSVDLEGENGPVAKAYVRLDLNYIEAFDAFPELAPQAVGTGENVPNLTAKSLDLPGLGYHPEPWLSKPGIMVYRKHLLIGEWDVVVGNFLVRYLPETGVLIAVNRREYEPVEDFTMGVDREAAIMDAASYLNIPGSTPTHVDLVQIKDGPSRFTNLNVYWEVKFDKGFIYVRCKDGEILVHEFGPSEPLGF